MQYSFLCCLCTLQPSSHSPPPIRAQTERKDRHAKREAGVITLDEADEPEPSSEIFEVEEYKSLKSGSLGTGDSLTTNLYVGNINPNVRLKLAWKVTVVTLS